MLAMCETLMRCRVVQEAAAAEEREQRRLLEAELAQLGSAVDVLRQQLAQQGAAVVTQMQAAQVRCACCVFLIKSLRYKSPAGSVSWSCATTGFAAWHPLSIKGNTPALRLGSAST